MRLPWRPQAGAGQPHIAVSHTCTAPTRGQPACPQESSPTPSHPDAAAVLSPRVLQLKETVEEAKVEAEEISRLALGRQASQGAGRQQPDPATGQVDDQPLDTSMDDSVQDNLVK